MDGRFALAEEADEEKARLIRCHNFEVAYVVKKMFVFFVQFNKTSSLKTARLGTEEAICCSF